MSVIALICSNTLSRWSDSSADAVVLAADRLNPSLILAKVWPSVVSVETAPWAVESRSSFTDWSARPVAVSDAAAVVAVPSIVEREALDVGSAANVVADA